MRKLISCKYHEDSQTVELLYTDGTLIDIDCMAVEDEVARNMYERSELDYLLTHDPVGYRIEQTWHHRANPPRVLSASGGN